MGNPKRNYELTKTTLIQNFFRVDKKTPQNVQKNFKKKKQKDY